MLEHAKLVALPVPMLIQVYVKPCEGPVRGPRAPRRGPKGSQEDPQGGSQMVILRGRSSKNGDFAWEVSQKWRDGVAKRMSS